MDADSENIHPSGQPGPSPPRCCRLAGTVLEFSVGHYTTLLNSYCRVVGNMVRSVNSMVMGPLLYFNCCKENSLIRSNIVWNTMMMAKSFYKSMYSSFGRNIVCWEGKSISRVNVCFSRSKMLPWKQSNVISLPPDSWLINLGNGAILRVSVGLHCWQTGHSAVAIARLVLMSPCC